MDFGMDQTSGETPAPVPAAAALDRLIAIMARLRDPATGCPWDVEQTFRTIAPFTIEEAYEVADACARDDMADLAGELGDLLLQVVFHARIAEERGAFAIADVIRGIADKMVRRHPHVFGDAVRQDGHAAWETIKAAERAATPAGDRGALAGVAAALPALMRAEKIQKRAARVGFDWPDATGARAKVDEELAEVAAAATAAERADEIGDLLFSCVNWARHLGVEPEAALRGATAKFEARFAAMEAAAGAGFAALPLDEKERLWAKAKAAAPR